MKETIVLLFLVSPLLAQGGEIQEDKAFLEPDHVLIRVASSWFNPKKACTMALLGARRDASIQVALEEDYELIQYEGTGQKVLQGLHKLTSTCSVSLLFDVGNGNSINYAQGARSLKSHAIGMTSNDFPSDDLLNVLNHPLVWASSNRVKEPFLCFNKENTESNNSFFRVPMMPT